MGADGLGVAVVVGALLLLLPVAEWVADGRAAELISPRAGRLIGLLLVLLGLLSTWLALRIARRRRDEPARRALSLLEADLDRPRQMNLRGPASAGVAPTRCAGMADGERARTAGRADPHHANVAGSRLVAGSPPLRAPATPTTGGAPHPLVGGSEP